MHATAVEMAEQKKAAVMLMRRLLDAQQPCLQIIVVSDGRSERDRVTAGGQLRCSSKKLERTPPTVRYHGCWSGTPA